MAEDTRKVVVIGMTVRPDEDREVVGAHACRSQRSHKERPPSRLDFLAALEIRRFSAPVSEEGAPVPRIRLGQSNRSLASMALLLVLKPPNTWIPVSSIAAADQERLVGRVGPSSHVFVPGS
jgi:hypothetical protein